MPLKYSPKVRISFIVPTLKGEEEVEMIFPSSISLEEALRRAVPQMSELQRKRLKVTLEGRDLPKTETLASLGIIHEAILRVER